MDAHDRYEHGAQVQVLEMMSSAVAVPAQFVARVRVRNTLKSVSATWGARAAPTKLKSRIQARERAARIQL